MKPLTIVGALLLVLGLAALVGDAAVIRAGSVCNRGQAAEDAARTVDI